MARKYENPRKVSFITSVDDWLDEKKKLEGAEGLWRIHDKLYDLTIWSRIHPGGKFWIDVTRGTDITEVFESHHLSDKAESILQKYYRREAAIPRNSPTTFSENGFYKVFKQKVSLRELEIANEHSLTVKLLNDALAASVFLTGLLGLKNGAPWTIVSGIFLGVLSISSHSFFHSKENWRINYFDLSLMSSRDWRIRHVLSHHPYRNTVSDLEIPIWEPFSGCYGKLGGYFCIITNLFMFFLAAHIQFLQRCTDVLLSRKLEFSPKELVGLSFPLFLFFFGGVTLWEAFVEWNLIIMIASFCFCIFSSSFYMCSTQIKLEENTPREENDFGLIQLSHTENHPNQNNFGLSFFNSFRGNVLHYLCPRINCESLHKFVPALEETLQEFGITYMKKPGGFLEGFENKMPQGNVYLGNKVPILKNVHLPEKFKKQGKEF